MSEENLPPFTPQGLMEWLKPVEDPELFLSLVELGLIYEVSIQGDAVDVKMTLTSPGCPSAGYLMQSIRDRLLKYPGVAKADVRLVFEPKWDPREMASEEAKDKLGIW
ncbi:MAG: metal-sulfur cluster assembly factor [Bdellovibrionales bacterium]|nr:metal-sulfur cluster assembly factor [Bdellovibrionales bacterium]